MDKTQIELLEKLTSILVHLTVFVASLVAIIKLKLYKLLEHRYQSEFRATHTPLSDNKILFEGDYVVLNTGERPIKLTKVDIGLYGVQRINGQVVIDHDNEIFKRVISIDDETVAGLMTIHSGEKVIFTVRCELSHLDDMMFVNCRFEWPYKRKPGSYLSLYVKSRGQTFAGYRKSD